MKRLLLFPRHKTRCLVCQQAIRRSEAPRRELKAEGGVLTSAVGRPATQGDGDGMEGAAVSSGADRMPPAQFDDPLPRYFSETEDERALMLLPRVFAPEAPDSWQRNLRKVACDLFDDRTLERHDLICPRCGVHLPIEQARGECDSRTIAIIGEKGVGKSHFIAALIQQLIFGPAASRAGFSVHSVDTFDYGEGEKRPSHNLWEKLYGPSVMSGVHGPASREKLGQTDSVLTNKQLRIPLIYRLDFDRPSALSALTGHESTSRRSLILALFDTPGEDLENYKIRTERYGFLTRLDGLIFLIDPLRLPGVWERLPLAARERNEIGSSQGHLLFSDLLNMDARMGRRLSTMPFAVALTKTDELRSVAYRGARFLRRSHHPSGFDVDDQRRTSAEIREMLTRWGQQNLVRGLTHFKRCSFFGISSLGTAPEDERITHYNPLRVADPLLWLLYQFGHLKAVRPD